MPELEEYLYDVRKPCIMPLADGSDCLCEYGDTLIGYQTERGVTFTEIVKRTVH